MICTHSLVPQWRWKKRPKLDSLDSYGWVRILSLSVLCILLCMIYAHWKPYKEIHFQFEPNLVSVQFHAIPIQGPSDKRTPTPLKLYSCACAVPRQRVYSETTRARAHYKEAVLALYPRVLHSSKGQGRSVYSQTIEYWVIKLMNLWDKDNLWRKDKSAVPKLSFLWRFHCIRFTCDLEKAYDL